MHVSCIMIVLPKAREPHAPFKCCCLFSSCGESGQIQCICTIYTRDLTVLADKWLGGYNLPGTSLCYILFTPRVMDRSLDQTR